MYRQITCLLLIAQVSSFSFAGEALDRQLNAYAAEARTVDPTFAGFSARRGEQFHTARFTGGKPDTPSCTSCHDPDPSRPGQTPTGKAIEPLSPRLTPARFSDPAKVDKWFRRNCREVLGRACTPGEKGDWLTFVTRH